MRKGLLFALVFILSFGKVYSQACIPSWSQPGSGIYPDTIVNMPVGPTDVPYDFTVQFKVPLKDSSIIVTGIDVDHVELTGVVGLENIPASVPFHYNCNPVSCSFEADSVGCVRIQGTPATEGIYPLVITAKVFITQAIFVPVEFSGYKIEISNTIGMPALQTNKFDVAQNSPNPAGSMTKIYVNLVHAGNIDIKVSNVIGNQVYKSSMMGHRGLNTVWIDASKFKTGVYFYTISDDKNSVTRRMIVDR